MQSESSPFPYTIANALFIPREGNRFDVIVVGRGFVDRAVPLVARVGSQPLHGIAIGTDGNSFSGRLERAPSPGDRLEVGYMDEGLQPTSIVYRGGDQPVA